VAPDPALLSLARLDVVVPAGLARLDEGDYFRRGEKADRRVVGGRIPAEVDVVNDLRLLGEAPAGRQQQPGAN
jgi:hypothetical protein